MSTHRGTHVFSVPISAFVCHSSAHFCRPPKYLFLFAPRYEGHASCYYHCTSLALAIATRNRRKNNNHTEKQMKRKTNETSLGTIAIPILNLCYAWVSPFMGFKKNMYEILHRILYCRPTFSKQPIHDLTVSG
jgi:hypothetical protein